MRINLKINNNFLNFNLIYFIINNEKNFEEKIIKINLEIFNIKINNIFKIYKIIRKKIKY